MRQSPLREPIELTRDEGNSLWMDVPGSRIKTYIDTMAISFTEDEVQDLLNELAKMYPAHMINALADAELE